MYAIAHGGCTETVRESAVKVDSGTESNLPQRRVGLMLYQQSYAPTQPFLSLPQYTPLFPLGFTLHVSNIMHPLILKWEAWALKTLKRNLKFVGECLLSFIAPSVWNLLPASLRNLSTLSEFKTWIKTFWFLQAFPQFMIDDVCAYRCVLIYI